MTPPLTVLFAVGARPNFVKAAPVLEAMAGRSGVQTIVVHTGQHYDSQLSEDILDDLDFPGADVFLGVGSGTHGEQTGRVLIEFERVLLERPVDLVVVSGDVNSTLACSLASAKLGVPIAHIESGLRSGDWTMPEEINRVLTDRLSDILLTHSPEATDNLGREGIDLERIHLVGNTMIDSLRRFEPIARERAVWTGLGLEEERYVLVTLHRPSNVDEVHRLDAIVEAVASLGRRAPVVFPLHPRTSAKLEAIGGHRRLEESGVLCLPSLRYLDFLSLECGALAIVTDSGGVQEEATALGVPCFTLRRNTERPITITHGTNTLLGDDPGALLDLELRPGATRQRCEVPLWDGRAGIRAADALLNASLLGSPLLHAS